MERSLRYMSERMIEEILQTGSEEEVKAAFEEYEKGE